MIDSGNWELRCELQVQLHPGVQMMPARLSSLHGLVVLPSDCSDKLFPPCGKVTVSSRTLIPSCLKPHWEIALSFPIALKNKS